MNNQSSVSSTVPQRLQQVRSVMLRETIDALLVPSADPHLSEYLPGHWQTRQWLSGFHGSVGTLVVTADFAGLWVDSRYWEQAASELGGSGIELVKAGQDQPDAPQWLVDHVPQGGVVGVDGQVLAVTTARWLTGQLRKRDITLSTHVDLFAEVWSDRPALPAAPVYEHAAPYVSLKRNQKLDALRDGLRETGSDAHLIAALDDIAWLLNLRGSDIAYNPLFLAFLLVEEHRATLFVDRRKIADPLRRALEGDGVELRDYEAVSEVLGQVRQGVRLLIDPGRVTAGLIEHLAGGVVLVEGVSPVVLAKACKSEQDLKHVRHVMEQDGAALCEFFAWFESHQGKDTITELTVDEQITAARARREGFVSPSFATIAAFNSNGAMPHYRATPQSHAVIEGDGLLLVDSGGQYLGGTTDITRMVAVGTPGIEQRQDCTRVLKGMIALSRARFPKGIRSPMLDAIARAPLWSEMVDYGHGTGHGVGYFLNVHEGPQSIAFRASATEQTVMHPGMITSIEPGTYRPGRWGVRIENLVATRNAGTGDFGTFLDFETLTLCPIDIRCLMIEMLDAREKAWLNDYHREVFQRLAPLLERDALVWLERNTQQV
ncbi:aminopeptidase P family protein [Pseudomonas cremoricolorata]|uniref:Peptidase M24 n=1 Tax=Pseudomonas cremoricolorata TaxID=157783 RepID=A0A089WV17_9PSED|nr:aminopeptidase P family protein [Pseudomonas cremoricolorata]AIR90417.1 peptidase M24 [Pseudomonas cremoricolorata]